MDKRKNKQIRKLTYQLIHQSWNSEELFGEAFLSETEVFRIGEQLKNVKWRLVITVLEI